ncbi:hypothetical protein RFI_18050 [Reticulomyxa filosa]|uniref:non-specific serine/threonine protein kinase n=1 Tax=Reticulomyxa filosa TaxID=46433 RepID=X6N0B2_RETFI|nr:hypothetical protein RFI_18050 [Reticulomyxa filosa]|eukprot:ETO19179.1 hypothetical protein RFI_18050 [Reticulomyxa filosa]
MSTASEEKEGLELSHSIKPDVTPASRYIPKRALADTRTGRLWLYKDTITNEYVAVKQYVKSGKTIDGLNSVVKLGEQKEIHLGFAQAFESWSDEKFDYIVMEYCNGGELYTFTETLYKHSIARVNEEYRKKDHSKIPIDNRSSRQLLVKDIYEVYTQHVKYIFKQLVECVHWMHSCGNVCHLHICLENVVTTMPLDTKNFTLDSSSKMPRSYSLDVATATTTPAEVVTPQPSNLSIGETFQEMRRSSSLLSQQSSLSLSRQTSEQLNVEAVVSKRVVLDPDFPVLVKLIDFGMAKRFDTAITTGNVTSSLSSSVVDVANDLKALSTNTVDFTFDKQVGKVIYMAPEVYAKSKYDARLADVWSLGVMLYMILARKKLYELPSDTDRTFKKRCRNMWIGSTVCLLMLLVCRLLFVFWDNKKKICQKKKEEERKKKKGDRLFYDRCNGENLYTCEQKNNYG